MFIVQLKQPLNIRSVKIQEKNGNAVPMSLTVSLVPKTIKILGAVFGHFSA